MHLPYTPAILIPVTTHQLLQLTEAERDALAQAYAARRNAEVNS